jgi:hypothetical protein
MNAALTLFTRFAGFIDSVKKTIAAGSAPVQGRPARLAAPLGPMLFNRLARLTTRLRELLARIEAERTKPRNPTRIRRTRPRDRTGRTTPERQPQPPPALPRRFGWIAHYLPEANGHAHTLRVFLCEPETESLIASDPRIGRILRPLCHMLGIDLHMIYRMVPQHRPTPEHPVAPTPTPDLTRRHPLLPANSPTTRRTPRRIPWPQKPPPTPLRAPTLDDVQSLLDRVFSPHRHTPGLTFFPPDSIIIHPK